MKDKVWNFPVTTERTRLISYLLYGLLLWTWACDQLKPTTGQRIALTNTSPQWVVHLSPRCSQVTLVSGYPFWQLSIDITWMSTIKLNTDCICLRHLASNARSLHKHSQSERTYCWSHIMNTDIELDSLLGQSSLMMYTTFTVKRHSKMSRVLSESTVSTTWDLTKMFISIVFVHTSRLRRGKNSTLSC